MLPAPAPEAARSTDPTLMPRWRVPGGRARVVTARAPTRWEAEVPDRACLDARVLSGSVELHTLYPDAHHATMVAWGHGSALIGECGQARSYPVDSAAEPLAIAVAPGERIDSAIAPGGTAPLELYALRGTTLVGADRASGIGGAARLLLPTGADRILLAPAPGAPEGPALLYINDLANDGDGDGLGAALEADLGTSDSLLDSDEDGIDDGPETMGYQLLPDPPQLLPAWGASPTHKDLFVEVDWEDDGGPAIGFCDGPGIIAPTAERFSRLRADSIANPDGQPGVALHVDSGVPGGGTTWGDWGGFSIVPRSADDAPETAQAWGYRNAFLPSRHRVFHYVFTHNRLGAAWGYQPGDQVMTPRLSQSAFQEEIGHNLNLGHNGAGRNINCKPNYHGHMNYAFNGDFSDGRFAAYPLNPIHLDETRGLGVPDAAQAAYLAGAPFYYTVRADGAVDWNRDGRFDTDVRAWINYPAYYGFSCENARYRIDGWGTSVLGLMDPVRPALGRDGPRLVVLYALRGQLLVRTMTDWVNCSPDITRGCGNWSPATSAGLAVGGGIAAVTLGAELHVVVPRQDGMLAHLALAGGDLHTVGSGLVEGAPAAGGDPGLAAQEGALVLLYPDLAGQLYELHWSGSWSPPAAVPGIVVTPSTGVSLALGTIGNDATPVLRAATVSGGRVTILRRDPGGWRSEPDAFTTETPDTDRAPTIAYAPGAPGTPARFYLMFRGVGATHVMRMDMTDRDGRFALPALQDNIWSAASAPPGLLYDPVGGNLRMARPGINQELLIWPYADGMFDVEMHDVDDAAIIRSGLCMGLKGCDDPTCPPPPPLFNACGGTTPTQVVDWPLGLPEPDPPL